MIGKWLSGDLKMKVTKPMMVGFASLWALGAYLIHPILWLVTIMIIIETAER